MVVRPCFRSGRVAPGERWVAAEIPCLMLTGPRLTLRELVDDDLDFLAHMLGDKDVMRYWPKPMDREESHVWLQRQQQRYAEFGCGYWLAFDHASQQPVGQAGVLMTEVDGEQLPALGYMIHRPFWRKGYGLEAARLCVQYIFSALDAPTAYTLIRPENEPSMQLALRLGMRPMRSVQYAGYKHVVLILRRDSNEAAAG